MADEVAITTESMEGVEPAAPAVESTDDNQPATVGEAAATEEGPVAMEAKEDDTVAVAETAETETAEPGLPKISIHVKTPKDKKSIDVDALASIKELKEETAKAFGVSVGQLCFIFSGKILQDEDQLSVHGIDDGSTVHLVIKSVPCQVEAKTPQQSEAASGATSEPTAVPQSFNPLDFAALGVDKLNYAQLQQQMQRQLASNPDLIRQMVQNPLVQQLMSNPSVVTNLMASNQQSKEWLQRNPELADMLKSQEVMQQTLEIAQNPEMLNELIAAQGKGRTQFGASVTSTPGGQLKFGAAATLPELQTLWQQLAQKPQILQQMYSMPYTKSLLEGFAANPQLAQQMIGTHPMFAGNAALQQQWQQMMPQFVQQMQSPTTQSLMTNPKALQAMLKIQQGMDMLHSEAPGLVNSTGLPFLSVPPPGFMPTQMVPPTSAATSQPDVMSNVMSQIVQQMATGRINLSPEERFKDQLEQLVSMGFTDQRANLNVLVRTFGDLVSAVEQLQQQQQPS